MASDALVGRDITRRSRLPSWLFVTTTRKGGAGKTETAECIDAIATLGGLNCVLLDVDDGNRGLARRSGLDNVTKIEWSTSATMAGEWIERNARGADAMIFDLGAGIDSADLPIMAFLQTVWRMLADQGARLTVCPVISTNAPIGQFIDRMERRYEGLGSLLVVCNNQDGSREFPKELSAIDQPKIHLGKLDPGIQAVRLLRQERLSSILRAPAPNYGLAGAIMARRVLQFAQQPVIREFAPEGALETLARLAADAPQRLKYAVTQKARAVDESLKLNRSLADAETALVTPDLDDAAILRRAKYFRAQFASYWNLPRL